MVLYVAARIQSISMIKMLLRKKGAEAFITNSSGKTAPDMMLAQNNQKLVMR